MGKFLAELKRRHIYRVAAAYAVVAWVLLQLVNNAAPALRLPEWAPTLVIVLLLVGFPITILAVWARELLPADGATARAATGKLDWALIGALAVVIALVSYQQLGSTTGARTTQQQASAAPAPGSISIAVLPFVNLSDDREQEFFSDGMTEEITSALARVPDLRVVGRTSAFQFKGQNQDLRTIGEALGANHLIEGSVRKEGNQLRITVQLIRAADGSHVWGESYDRELIGVFAIQEEIAQAIAASLRVPLGLQRGETLVGSRTKDEGSYENYLRAKALVRTPGQGPLTEAAKLLEQVVATNPEFAPGWALLGLDYALIPRNGTAWSSGAIEQLRPLVETYLPRAEAAASRAIQLDPKNPDGYIALGMVQKARGKYLAAGDLFARASALDPDNPDGLAQYSWMLAGLGYVKQALPMRQRLQVLEPFVPIFRTESAIVLAISGQTDAAIAMLRSTSDILASYYAEQGRYGEAADALQLILAGEVLNALPATGEAAARLLRTAPGITASPQTLPRLGNLGWVYLHIGAPARVLDWYEDTLESDYRVTAAFLWSQAYEGIRKTERFKSYARNSGMVEYWRARGWPDLCRPMGADDFVCD